MSVRKLGPDEFAQDKFYNPREALEHMCETFSDGDLRSGGSVSDGPDDSLTLDKFNVYETSDGDLIAELKPTTGPRAPDWVWDGPIHEDFHDAYWICSEDDLTLDQKALMDRVAKHCPGGLGGWS